MLWIINEAGPVADVIDKVKALKYETFRSGKTEQLERLKKHAAAKSALGQGPSAEDVSDAQGLAAELARMDAGDEAMFESARTAVLDLLHGIPPETYANAGATARAVKNPKDAPHGQTLSISVSGYDG